VLCEHLIEDTVDYKPPELKWVQAILVRDVLKARIWDPLKVNMGTILGVVIASVMKHKSRHVVEVQAFPPSRTTYLKDIVWNVRLLCVRHRYVPAHVLVSECGAAVTNTFPKCQPALRK
jgi:hypothetical protein